MLLGLLSQSHSNSGEGGGREREKERVRTKVFPEDISPTLPHFFELGL